MGAGCGGRVDDIVRFPAQIVKVQTLVDHGIRVTLDLPETCVIEMAQLAEFKRLGVAGEFVFEPRPGDGESKVSRKIHI